MRKLLLILTLVIWFTLPLICMLTIPSASAQTPTYYYVATAVDANGFESAYSNQVTATFAQGQKTTSLTWVAPAVPAGGSAIAGYNIYRSKVSGGPYAKINAALVTGVAYSDPFVLPNAPSLSETTQ
jgi:hypothetical protein